MTQKFVTIPPEVKAVLRRAKIAGKSLKITEQLARPLYVSVNKILELAGGKWNRKAAAHIFPSDPRKILRLAVTEGEILNEKQTFQLFPTPPDLAARMVAMANLRTGHLILEPSVGTGALLDAIVPACMYGGLTLVEVNPKLAHLLRVQGYYVHQKDFLECNGKLGTFDRIIMNPPFVNGADIKHIEHALTMLKPGGRLVAICANGSRQNEKLKPLADTWEELPAGTFKEQGTGVNTVLLTINKTETNTQTMRKRVLRAAHESVRFHSRPRKLQADFEHGQWWITDIDTGAQWSVIDAQGRNATDGFDFEQVTEGDEDD